MLRYEVKKVFSRTGSKIALLILTAVLALTGFLTVGSVEYVDEQGNSNSGIRAARRLREDKICGPVRLPRMCSLICLQKSGNQCLCGVSVQGLPGK